MDAVGLPTARPKLSETWCAGPASPQMSRKTRQEGRAQGMSTVMGKEGKEKGVPGCKVQPTGDYGPPRREEEAQSSRLREEGLPSPPATAQCGL